MTHPDGQLWGDIEWAVELLYDSVKTGSQLVLETRPVGDAVEKASIQQRAGPPGLRLSNLENEKDIRVGVNILQFCSVSNFLSHEPFQIK